ncbi:hypothetical protein Tco_0105733 [Tanacetum coccineum]
MYEEECQKSRPKASTSNLFDAFKMVENDDELGKDGSNIGKNKESVLVNMESESDVDEVYNETASFMASKSGDEAGMKSLFEHLKNDYNENPYDEDEREDLTEDN